jgi:hypothetical protein
MAARVLFVEVNGEQGDEVESTDLDWAWGSD